MIISELFNNQQGDKRSKAKQNSMCQRVGVNRRLKLGCVEDADSSLVSSLGERGCAPKKTFKVITSKKKCSFMKVRAEVNLGATKSLATCTKDQVRK